MTMNGVTEKMNYDRFFRKTALKRTINYLRYLGEISLDYPEAVLFSNGIPNPETFPVKGIDVALKDGTQLEIRGDELEKCFIYLKAEGYAPLLELLKEFHDKMHGTQDWTNTDIITVSGCQDGLFKIYESCVDCGDPVLVQSPTYTGMTAIVEPYDAEILEVDSDEYGLDPNHLKDLLAERFKKQLSMPKLLYVNPTGSNPTGQNISTERKKSIYKIACDHDLLIVEDDPYFAIHYKNEKIVSFQAIDTERRVIRLDSVSKTLGAGFRIGYVVCAKEIIDKLRLHCHVSNVPSALAQVTLYKILESMGYDGFVNHMHEIAKFYKTRRDFMLQCLDQYMKDLAEWIEPEGGLFVWMKIKNVDTITQEFVTACMNNMVFIAPGFIFIAPSKKAPYIRLSFSTVTEKQMLFGIKKLTEVLQNYVSKK